MKGEATVANQEYRTELVLTQDKGKVGLTARYNPVKLAYEANLRIDSLEPTHFMPKDSLFWLTALLKQKAGAQTLSLNVHGPNWTVRYRIYAMAPHRYQTYPSMALWKRTY